MEWFRNVINILSTGTIGGIVTFGFVFIFKNVFANQINHKLNRDLERFKADLSTNIANDIQMQNNIYMKKVEFAEKISQLYFDIYYDVKLIINQNNVSTKMFDDLRNHLDSVRNIMGKIDLYFDDTLYNEITNQFFAISRFYDDIISLPEGYICDSIKEGLLNRLNDIFTNGSGILLKQVINSPSFIKQNK